MSSSGTTVLYIREKKGRDGAQHATVNDIPYEIKPKQFTRPRCVERAQSEGYSETEMWSNPSLNIGASSGVVALRRPIPRTFFQGLQFLVLERQTDESLRRTDPASMPWEAKGRSYPGGHC